jgi:hypothetical protein
VWRGLAVVPTRAPRSLIIAGRHPCTGGFIRLGKTNIITTARFVAVIAIFIAVYVTALAFASGAAFAASQPEVRPCKTVTPQVFNKQVRKLDKITKKRHHKASRKVCKEHYQKLIEKIEKVCRPAHVVTGRTSVFDDHNTYTGLPADEYEGLAINISPGTNWGYSNATVRRWADNGTKFIVKLKGKQRVTRLIDLGPAGWVNRALDFSRPLANAMGFYNFPTDSVGSLWRLRKGC